MGAGKNDGLLLNSRWAAPAVNGKPLSFTTRPSFGEPVGAPVRAHSEPRRRGRNESREEQEAALVAGAATQIVDVPTMPCSEFVGPTRCNLCVAATSMDMAYVWLSWAKARSSARSRNTLDVFMALSTTPVKACSEES